jgi:heme-degrading monooxygenase HmoA
MFACSFIFRPGTYDEEFHRLDASIDEFAQSLDGYIGVDRWISGDGTVKNSIYYWRDMDSVSTFARFPDHLDAKKNYRKWYDGYQIVISEVTASYGDGRIPHITAEQK